MLAINDVEKIAKLAKFNLTSHEKEKFQKLLSEALDYVEVLNELDTNAVDISDHASGLKNVFREDIIGSTSLRLDPGSAPGSSPGLSGMTNGGKYFVTDAVLKK